MNSICFDKQYGKNFDFGSGVAPIGGRLCQLYLAQACASSPNSACTQLKFDDKYLPGFDMFSRPIVQNQQEAFLRNIALNKYTFTTSGDCQVKNERVLGTISVSPHVTYYQGNKCTPHLTLTPEQIKHVNTGQDKVLLALLSNRPVFDDILNDIRLNMQRSKTWEQIKEGHRW